jgi:hypothetical protein
MLDPSRWRRGRLSHRRVVGRVVSELLIGGLDGPTCVVGSAAAPEESSGMTRPACGSFAPWISVAV